MKPRSTTCADKQSADATKAAYARWSKNTLPPDEPGEFWRDVPSVPGYQASNKGRVRSRYKILKAHALKKSGHLMVSPSVAGRQRPMAVHVMVCEAWNGPKNDPKLECRHRDGVPSNNRPVNLCWGTKLENQRDRWDHDTCNTGQRNGKATLTNEQAIAIYRRARAKDDRRAIAKDFGVTVNLVGLIAGGHRWSAVTGHIRGDARSNRQKTSHAR